MWDPLEKNHVTQNLIDAGCDEGCVKSFLDRMESNAYQEQMQL